MPRSKRYANIAFDEQLWESANILAVRKRMSFTRLVNEAVSQYMKGGHVEVIHVDADGTVTPPEAATFLTGLTALRRR